MTALRLYQVGEGFSTVKQIDIEEEHVTSRQLVIFTVN